MRKDYNNVNSYYMGLIQNLYGGSKGCFVAFMQFFYQYNQSKVFDAKYQECFKKLYEIEIENCEILSELLLRMGGENKFYSSSFKFVSAQSVDYVQNFEKMFFSDIEFLEIGVADLKSVTSKIENLEIRKRLSRVLQNKKASLKILRENYFKNKLI